MNQGVIPVHHDRSLKLTESRRQILNGSNVSLIVDNGPTVRTALALYLEREDFEIVVPGAIPACRIFAASS
jgi:hypothetical protein